MSEPDPKADLRRYLQVAREAASDDQAWWEDYRNRLEKAARDAGNF